MGDTATRDTFLVKRRQIAAEQCSLSRSAASGESALLQDETVPVACTARPSRTDVFDQGDI